VGVLNRIASTRGDPNNFALTLVAVIPIAVALIKTEKRTTIKVILALTTGIVFSAVALTLSRGGYLALLVVLLIMVLRSRKKALALLIFLVVLGFSLSLLPAEVWERAGTAIMSSGTDPSIRMRTQLLRGGIEMFMDHSLFGVGIGNFLTHSFHYSGVLPPSHAHNMFLHIAAETGIFGFLLFMALLWTTWRVLRRTQKAALRRKDAYFFQVSQGLETSLIGFCVAAFFLSQHFNKMLWILIALATSIGRMYLRPHKSHLSSNGLHLD
jgi:O-antigen ligase